MVVKSFTVASDTRYFNTLDALLMQVVRKSVKPQSANPERKETVGGELKGVIKRQSWRTVVKHLSHGLCPRVKPQSQWSYTCADTSVRPCSKHTYMSVDSFCMTARRGTPRTALAVTAA